MKTDIYSETLGNLYEEQGYYLDALEQYNAVNRDNPSPDMEEAVKRMRRKLEEHDTEDLRRDVIRLAGQWMRLLLLRRRLKSAEKICSGSGR